MKLVNSIQRYLNQYGQPLPSRSGLTVWSSRHQQAPLVGSLRASHSGAAYRGR